MAARNAGRAVKAATPGTDEWRAPVRVQQSVPVDHNDMYALAGLMVETLTALDDMAAILTWRAARYATRDDLSDDAGSDPARRLRTAASQLDTVRTRLGPALAAVNAYHSTIGHIRRAAR